VSIEIPEGGTGKAIVVIQGLANCSELPAVPSDCTTKRCRFIRHQLARRCGTMEFVSTLASRPRNSSQLVVIRKFSKKFGRRRRSAQGQLRLNKLGRALLRQNQALPLQVPADIQDRQGATLTRLFRTLLRLR
jgi:hypothetical protein